MRLVFAGTPEFAVTILTALRARGHHITLVLTQPDRPSGRGLRSTFSAVKQAALDAGLTVRQPPNLKTPALQDELAQAPADAWVVAAYGLILPKKILNAPRHGCINVHASLLPRWRGAAPIQRAIMAGDRETGVSIMRMDEGLDTGPVFERRAVSLAPDETAGCLHDRLAGLGAELLCDVLDRLAQAPFDPEPQPAEGACYAPKLTRDDSVINWALPAENIERQLRALNPAPGAVTSHAGQSFKIWRATPTATGAESAPGNIIEVSPRGIVVRCGSGALVITELQRAGGKRMGVEEFLRGAKLVAGMRFGD